MTTIDSYHTDMVMYRKEEKIDTSEERVAEKVKCNQHPDAPHGFNRSASHCLGRYVCECEGWTPEEDEAWIDKLRDLAGMTA